MQAKHIPPTDCQNGARIKSPDIKKGTRQTKKAAVSLHYWNPKVLRWGAGTDKAVNVLASGL